MPPLPTSLFDVLLIEDNEADVDLTTAAFRDALVNAHVHVVGDGEEAMVFLRENAIRPDLVILDLGLPIGDGFEVLEALKANPKLRTIPVIVMSGSDRSEDQARAYRLQAAAYIVKPANKDKYFAAIRSIKELWTTTSRHHRKKTTQRPKEDQCAIRALQQPLLLGYAA